MGAPATSRLLLTDLQDGDVLFVDEIHRLSRGVEEILYPAMEDRRLDVMIGRGPSALAPIRLDPAQLHAAWARPRGPGSSPRRYATDSGWSMANSTSAYDPAGPDRDRQSIGRSVGGDTEGRRGVDHRQPVAAGVMPPRIAECPCFEAVRDFAAVQGHDVVDDDVAVEGLALFGVDEFGLDKIDRRILGLFCQAVRRQSSLVGSSTTLRPHACGEEPSR